MTVDAAQPSTRRRFNDDRLRLFGTRGRSAIAFICECDTPDCKMTILLTPEQYVERRSGPIRAHA